MMPVCNGFLRELDNVKPAMLTNHKSLFFVQELLDKQ